MYEREIKKVWKVVIVAVICLTIIRCTPQSRLIIPVKDKNLN